MRDGATAGYRYFDIQTAKLLTVEVRGTGRGEMVVRDGRIDGNVVARIPVEPRESWDKFSSLLNIASGRQALYFTFEGEGAVDFMSFTFGK